MQTIDKFNFAGKKAFVRVDFNVPLDENFNITDDTRMRAALPTLKKILADGGSIIIGSHLGRPKGVADKFSLKHIIKHLSELLGVEVQFANDCMGEEAAVKAAALQPGKRCCCSKIFVSMLKKKANQEVWRKTRQTKKRLLRRGCKRRARKNLPRNWLLTLTATLMTHSVLLTVLMLLLH